MKKETPCPQLFPRVNYRYLTKRVITHNSGNFSMWYITLDIIRRKICSECPISPLTLSNVNLSRDSNCRKHSIQTYRLTIHQPELHGGPDDKYNRCCNIKTNKLLITTKYANPNVLLTRLCFLNKGQRPK